MTKRNKTGVPPGMAESPRDLELEARAVSGNGKEPAAPAPARRGPGRPKSRPDPVDLEPAGPAFPLEALAVLHAELWGFLARRFRSRYSISAETSREMATYADLVLRQYAGPALADNAALASYAMTQITAVLALFALRPSPDELQPAPAGPAPAMPSNDAPLYRGPRDASDLGVPQ